MIFRTAGPWTRLPMESLKFRKRNRQIRYALLLTPDRCFADFSQHKVFQKIALSIPLEKTFLYTPVVKQDF